MTLPASPLYRFLAFTGAIPFIACAVMLVLGYPNAPFIGRYDDIAAAYALTILSFMSGTHWGTYLHRNDQIFLNLFVTSNIVTVSSWIVFLVLPVKIMFFFSMAGFTTLLLIDHHLHRQDLISRSYYATRRNVTSIVIVCLLILGLA